MIQEVSKCMKELLIKELYPSDLLNPDGVQLCVPKHDMNDYQIGIYLYDIEEDHLHEKHYSRIVANQRVYPPKMVFLRYLIFVNEEVAFGGYNKEQEEHLLERLLQCFHDHGELELEDTTIQIHFDSLDLENKIRLWQSLNKTLQPALYIKASPIQILSKKTEEVHKVQSIDIRALYKEE